MRLGAMTRHRDVLDRMPPWPSTCPIFADAERVIADPVVRNRGTIGGSLCQADPAEDLSAVCEVLGAVVVVRGPSGQREIAIEDFQLGPYETALAHNEMLIEVRIPLRHHSVERLRQGGAPGRRLGGGRRRLRGDPRRRPDRRRPGRADAPSTPTPRRWPRSPTALVGSPPTEETFAEAGRLAAAGLRARHRPARHRRLQAPPGRRTDHPHAAHRGAAGPRHP